MSQSEDFHIRLIEAFSQTQEVLQRELPDLPHSEGRRLKLLLALGRAAAFFLLGAWQARRDLHFHENIEYTKDTPFDGRTSQLFVQGVRSHPDCRDDVVVTEQALRQMVPAKFAWLADPLDRTQGYALGDRDWATSLIVLGPQKEKKLVGALFVIPAEAQVWLAIGEHGGYLNGQQLPLPSEEEKLVGVVRRPRPEGWKKVRREIKDLYLKVENGFNAAGWTKGEGKLLSAVDILELAARPGRGGVAYYAKIWDVLAAAAVANEARRTVSFIPHENPVPENRAPVFPLCDELQLLTGEARANERAFFVIE